MRSEGKRSTEGTLFFSLLVGTLAAWGGFLLLAAFGTLGFDITDVELPSIKLDVQRDIGLLGLAFTLGFSEKIFNGFTSALEARREGFVVTLISSTLRILREVFPDC